ncbi:MAG: BrnT family toxin [Treponema sp.]|jgi:uncharacterized DUF497 family protein|nr:BrnT family toxin [Treponema sp.]
MGEIIELEYDLEKNMHNIEERGLPFDLAEFVLTDPNVVTEADYRRNYGEERFLSYGKVEGLRLCLCWTPRNGRIRVITLFKVHEKEWEKHYGKDN